MQVIGIAGNSNAGKDTVADLLTDHHGFVAVAFADELKRLLGKIFMYDNATLFGPPSGRNKIDTRPKTDMKHWAKVLDNANTYQEDLTRLFDDSPLPLSYEMILGAFVGIINVCERQKDLTLRFVLQQVGTEWGRKLWDKVWVYQLGKTVSQISQGRMYSREGGITPMTVKVDSDRPRPDGIVVVDSRFPNEGFSVCEMGGKLLWIDASTRAPKDPSIAHSSEPNREDFIVNGIDLISYDLDNNGTLEELPARLTEALRFLSGVDHA